MSLVSPSASNVQTPLPPVGGTAGPHSATCGSNSGFICWLLFSPSMVLGAVLHSGALGALKMCVKCSCLMSYLLLPTDAVIVCMGTLNVYPRMKTALYACL